MQVLFVISFAILGGQWRVEALEAINSDKNLSEVAIAISEIIKGLQPRQLAILTDLPATADPQGNNVESLEKHVDDFIYQLHNLYIKSVIFNNITTFFDFVETSLKGSIESVNLIFKEPYELSHRIHQRRLAHRLSLFIFYWGAKFPPRPTEVHFYEPIRAVVITRPRNRAFRIYYNQATPDGQSNLRLVNWYDGDNLGLQHLPLLPPAASVYSNFNGRIFRVPVFHSPPWFWVSYENETSTNNGTTMNDFNSYVMAKDWSSQEVDEQEVEVEEEIQLNVTGGRDHMLLVLLAEHMNFQFVYINAPGRTQGILAPDADLRNETFSGGIGLLQNGLADLLLGDVSLSWERRKAVEFSFFTLADSGAFATHAPRRLNEALAIVRPFKTDVWIYLILTLIFSGPIFYAIIVIPHKWSENTQEQYVYNRRHDVEYMGELKIFMPYIREITINSRSVTKNVLQLNLQSELLRNKPRNSELPNNLFDRCVWFIIQLFLKQSCKVLDHSYHAKFLMIVYWIAATYVLADVYSAQLTSQFARPEHEAPINTLHRLQKAMIEDGYRLYVERGSSSLEMLENGTEIFRNLIALMKQQSYNEENGYLIDSVEAGVSLIADGLENKAVFGGRETLFFNIQQFGSKTFQLSQKLYTRYSAVAVQIGCPFLDSLNDVLIHLFEGGIIDKMTTAEYEAQSRMISKEANEQQKSGEELRGNVGSSASGSGSSTVSSSVVINTASKENPNNNDATGKSAKSDDMQEKTPESPVILPLNLRMLQGAFIVLLLGYISAALILTIEMVLFYNPGCGLSGLKTKILNKYPSLRWSRRRKQKLQKY